MRQGKIVVSVLSLLILFQSITFSQNLSSSSNRANILYVSPTGSTYRSLSEAFQNCSSGDTLIIGRGNYSERAVLDKDNVRIVGNDSKNCIIKNSYEFTPSIIIYGDNVIIQDIQFNNSGENKTSLSIKGNNTSLNNCSFYLDGKYNHGITVDSQIYNLSIMECNFKILGIRSHGLRINKKAINISLINNSYYVRGIESSGALFNLSSNILVDGCIFYIYGMFDNHDDNPRLNNGILLIICDNIEINNCYFNLIGVGGGRHLCCGIGSQEGINTQLPINKGYNLEYLIKNLSIHDCIFEAYYWNYLTLLLHVNSSRIFNILIVVTPIKYIELFCSFLFSKDIIINNTNNITIICKSVSYLYILNNHNMNIDSYGVKNSIIKNNALYYYKYNNRDALKIISVNNLTIEKNIIINDNGGGICLTGSNILIKDNIIDVKAPIFYAGITIDNLLHGQEQKYSYNVTIINNTIYAKGNKDLHFEWPGVAGIYLEDLSGGYVADNKIESLGIMAMGSWFKNVLYVTVTNNTYKVYGNKCIGWNFGIIKGMVDQYWKDAHSSTYINNSLDISGDNAKAIRMEYKVNNNIIENNNLKIHDGKNLVFIDAKFDVDQSVHFSNVERWNTIGNDAILSDNAKIRTINAEITNASISEDSGLEVMQELSVGVKNYDRDPEPYADIRIRNREMEHSTPGYGGSQPYPGEKGYIGPFTVWDRIFDGSSTSTKYKTNMSVQLEGDIPWNTSVEMNIHRKTHYEFSVPNLTRPQIPTGLRADQIPGTQDLRISWDPVLENCWKYELEYTMGAEWTRLAIVDHPDTVFVHVGLDQDQWVSYRIRSYNGFLYSMFSPPIDAISGDITRPDAPSGFRIINISHDMIEVAWNKSLDKDAISSELWITRERSSEKLKEVSLPIDVLGHTFKDLGQDTDYDIYLMFRDDADLYSRMVAISVRTRNMTTRVDISVIYEPGSAWEGPAPGLKVSLVGTNYTHPSGTTDQYGICRFEDVHIPDSIMIVVDPPSVLAGEAGVREGYLRIRSGPYTLSDPSYELDLDLVMEYYTRIIPEVKGKISGVVFYPLFGYLSGQAAVGSTVVLESSAGTEYRLESSSEGGFVLDNISLPASLSVTAYPPSSSLEHYRESNTRNIILDTSSPSVSLNLTLVYKHPEIDPVYVSVIGYGPVGKIKDLSSPIWIEFSHPISGALDYDWIDIDPLFEGVEISLSGDRRTITVDHAGLHLGIEYKVSVSDRIPFEGAEGLNQSFVWRFSVESENDGGNGPIRDNNTLIFIIISAVLFLSLFIAFFIWLRRRSSVSKGSQIGDLTDSPNHHEE